MGEKDAPTRPSDEGGRKKGTPLTRRNFVTLALTAGASLILAPRAALADYEVRGGWFGSAGNGSILKHGNGNWIGSRSGWFSWVCGYSEWIGVAAGLWVESQYSNELYDSFRMQPLCACRDWNDQNGLRLWRSRYRDNRLKYWCDGGMTEDHGWALTNEHLGPGYGGWWATGLRDFGYPGKEFFFRRQAAPSSHAFGLSAGFYNVSVGVYAGGPWRDWENCYLWINTNGGYQCADPGYQGADFENDGGVCPGDIDARQDGCRLENRWDLFGGVWKLTSACAEGNGQCVEVSGGDASSGADVRSWEYLGATSQNWCVNPGGVDSLNGGHNHSLYPAHRPVLALAEPAGEAGPSAAPTTGHSAKVYTQKSGHAYQGHSEREFWIGGSKDLALAHSYITCDATGRCLDLYARKAENGTAVQFYSNGYDGQWDNAAEQWDFEEVRFEGSVEMPEECKVGDGPVRCSDPAATCRPYDASATGQTPYIYRFMTTAAQEAIEEDGARVVGAYMRNGWGQVGLDGRPGIDRGIPAHRYIGLPREMWSDGQRVTDFALWVENTAFGGSLECTAHLAGGGAISGSFPVAQAGPGASAGWLNGRSSSADIVGVEFWLSGEIARHYDLDYRAYSRAGHWSGHCYSDGDGNHPVAGDMATSLGCFQIHMVPKPADAKVVREWSTDPEYEPGREASGRFLHCLCRLSAVQPGASASAAAGGDYGDHDWMFDRYQGTVASLAPTRIVGDLEVSYYVDGEEQPCYRDRTEAGVAYTPPAAAGEAAQKDGCLEVSGWFVDPGYTEAYAPCEHEEGFSLYAYNSCSLEYDTADGSCVLDPSYGWKADEAMTTPLDLSAAYPAPAVVRWGDEVTFAGPWSAWCTDMGRVRKATSTPGVYATRAAGGSPLLKASVKRNSTVFVDWPWDGYDGVSSDWL